MVNCYSPLARQGAWCELVEGSNLKRFWHRDFGGNVDLETGLSADFGPPVKEFIGRDVRNVGFETDNKVSDSPATWYQF